MTAMETISATEFKAKCLDILDRIRSRELERVVITKRGQVVAVLTPPEDEAARVRQLHGFMRGTVIIPDDVDLTAPILDEPFTTEDGNLHE
jgi:prevent-host-death family protein